MIQRIQTIWLLMAAIFMAGVFYFPVYRFNNDSGLALTIGNNFLGIILAVLSIILCLVTIFRFKDRKSQIGLTWINILICVGLQVWLFLSTNNYRTAPAQANLTGYYWIGIFIPLVCIILLFIAKAGIKKDEKLVKSLERLR